MRWPAVLELHSSTPTHPYGWAPTRIGSMRTVDEHDLTDRLAWIASNHPNVHYVDSIDLRRRWTRDPNDSRRLVEMT